MTALEIMTTAADGPASALDRGPRLGPMLPVREDRIAIFVDPEQRRQSLLGIGGAITDASAEVFHALPEESRRTFLRACWDRREGNAYSLARTTVHSCDFSPHSYTYVDDGDMTLATFSIAHDLQRRIPLLQAAREAAGDELTLFASAWSAPAYMKDNACMLNGGRLLPSCRRLWADYLARFLRSYEEAGLPCWGLTVQNEPAAVQRWESMLWEAEEERDFVRDHLAPALRDAGLGHVQVIGWDHNRDLLPQRARVLLGDPETAALFWGLGFHWYETWSGGEPLHENVAAVAAAYPDKGLLLTECCIEGFERDRIGDWAHAERYASAIIADLNAGASGWCDWNVLLDLKGGPNHVGNYCHAPVHADTTTGELLFSPVHHAIGHFSRYLRPGATRIAATSSRSALRTTAFHGAQGEIIAVVLNLGGQAAEYDLHIGERSATLHLPARSIQTVRCAA